jgi:hypothetical protein
MMPGIALACYSGGRRSARDAGFIRKVEEMTTAAV